MKVNMLGVVSLNKKSTQKRHAIKPCFMRLQPYFNENISQ